MQNLHILLKMTKYIIRNFTILMLLSQYVESNSKCKINKSV